MKVRGSFKLSAFQEGLGPELDNTSCRKDQKKIAEKYDMLRGIKSD